MPRLNLLDGLRGLAAIFVLLYHVFCDGLPFDVDLGNHLKLFLPFNGAMAVFIFFLVSGFSLSNRYLIDGDLRSWTQTMAGRYIRLAVPIFFACLFVHVAMLFGAIDPPDDRLERFQDALMFTPTLDHLIRFSFYDVFFDYRDTYIGPLWTMRFELLGSLIALLAVVIARRLPFRQFLFLAIAILLLIFTPDSYYAMLALFPIGCTLADAFHRGWIVTLPPWVGALLICVAVLIPLFTPYSVTAWGVVGATALIVGCIAVPQVRRFLETPLSVRLGDLCFPLYLIHGPVMWLIGEPLMRRAGASIDLRIAVDLLTIVASFGAAYAFLPFNSFAVRIAHNFGQRVTFIIFSQRPASTLIP